MEKIIADVSGKGIPAALFMMTSKAIIQNCAKLGIGAAQILAKTNSTLCSGNDADMFVTAWVGILEIKTGRMTCANAGASPRDLLKIVRTSIGGFVGGAKQFDGITMLCLKYHG